MSLLHPAILYGLGLVTLPVLLHFMLRQKPKKLLFPALQLIASRKQQNVSRMRLRHFWLLLLRMLVIGLLVAALARPSVPAADYSLNLREGLTIAGLLAAAIGAYLFLSSRWKSASLPKHERRHRQTRLRSWLIGGTLGLLLLAVAWPYQRRIAAELKAPSPAGDVSLPVAAVFLFDTSLSMQYQQEGKTRLDLARALAIEHLSDLATGSKVAVADVANDNPILFQTTVAGAKTRIESLETHPRNLPFNDRIRAALRLHKDDRSRTLAEQSSLAVDERKDRYIRRIYVLTDLARSAFRIGGTSRLANVLEEQPTVNLFLVDVSHPSPINTALTTVEPSRTRIGVESTFMVQAIIHAVGHPAGETVDRTASPSEDASTNDPTTAEDGRMRHRSYTVELLLHDALGKPIKVDQQTVQLIDETPQVITFGPLTPEFGPVIHGDIRLVSSDPLTVDNTRHFTVEVRPPTEVLVVSPTREEADAWAIALEVNGYKVVDTRPDQIGRFTLSDFGTVCLINVPSLPDNDWYRLGQYVEHGGGLALFLGSTQVNSVNYSRDEAQVFLPGKPDVHSSPGVSFLNINNELHPLFRLLSTDDGIALLEAADINRFWRVTPTDDARILARYTEDREAPALLERAHGDGRTVMLTTAVDIKGFGRDWNIIASPQGPAWTFTVFADALIRYLSHESESRLTYDVPDTPVLRFTAAEQEQSFLLQQPAFRQSRVSLPAGETRIAFVDATDLGHYDLKSSGDKGSVVAGFSVNPNPGESDFTLVQSDELDKLFGEERYQVARSIEELKESINIADLGREMFPLLLTALVMFFLGEHFVANWFYGDEGKTDTRSSWTSPKTDPVAA